MDVVIEGITDFVEALAGAAGLLACAWALTHAARRVAPHPARGTVAQTTLQSFAGGLLLASGFGYILMDPVGGTPSRDIPFVVPEDRWALLILWWADYLLACGICAGLLTTLAPDAASNEKASAHAEPRENASSRSIPASASLLRSRGDQSAAWPEASSDATSPGYTDA